jgi:WD40 repeat protein
MELFIENYGSTFDFPGLHILDAKIYPKNTDLIVQLVKYVIPTKNI